MCVCVCGVCGSTLGDMKVVCFTCSLTFECRYIGSYSTWKLKIGRIITHFLRLRKLFKRYYHSGATHNGSETRRSVEFARVFGLQNSGPTTSYLISCSRYLPRVDAPLNPEVNREI